MSQISSNSSDIPGLSVGRILRLRSNGLQPNDPAEAPVDQRTSHLPGYDGAALHQAHVLLVGCGGLGGEIGHGLVRNGIGNLTLCDHDSVELSNLNRQRFFRDDLYKNKAIQLARNLHAEAVLPLMITGMAMQAEEALENPKLGTVSAVICGVDNDTARVLVSRWAIAHRSPAIFTAVNNAADYGYVFVQRSSENSPCFGCLFPDAVTNTAPAPCNVAASIDILKVVAGLVLYALGAQLMPARKLLWHYKEIDFTGALHDGVREIPKRSDCPICGRA